MFDYPLPVPHDTPYRELGVEPDASDGEVRAAIAEARRRLQAEKTALEKGLERVYAQVPELRTACDELQSLQARAGQWNAERARELDAAVAELEAQGAEGAGGELAEVLTDLRNQKKELEEQARALERLRVVQEQLSGLEQRATAIAPAWKRDRARCVEIEEKIAGWNRLALDKPEERRAWDRAHPPLALLRLADCAGTNFAENHTILFLIRREVSRYLEERGEEVFHPSDLTRESFSADFHFHALLDGDGDD